MADDPKTLSPVESIGDEATNVPEEGVGLCLSGGGYRAMVFHLGAIWRLNELGYLPKLKRVSSVSGGSITAGLLGLRWNKLQFDASGVATNLGALLIDPIRTLASHTIDVDSVLGGVFLPGTVADRIADKYRKYLFDNATLQELPDNPRFVINATNVQSKSLWRFSKPYMWDWRVGKVQTPRTELAIAVGASSAFPPVLSPVELDLKETDYVANSGAGLQKPPYTTEVVLTDGGVYDNLGLETVWKRYSTVLVSDGGGLYGPEPDPKRDWIRHTMRVFDLVDNQVRSLRKRQVIDSFVAGTRKGTYWGIWSDIGNYQVPNSLPCPVANTNALASIATRLESLNDSDQQKLINWGYAICDAAMRKHLGVAAKAPAFPYPGGV